MTSATSSAPELTTTPADGWDQNPNGPGEKKPAPSWLPDELVSALTAGGMLACGFALSYAPGPAGILGEVLIWGSLCVGMLFGGQAALESLRERKFDIDVLMAVAAALAAWMGHPEEGALLLFLFVLAGALEHRAVARAKRAVEALHKLMPTSTQVWRGSGWVDAPPDTLVPGERVRIRPGELAPTDARVAEGHTAFDQATLTGESVPRSVGPGSDIYAGTLNVGHPIVVEVLRPVRESSLQRILNLVIAAQEQREPLQRIIDRFSEPYALGVLAISIVVFVVWWLGFAEPWESAVSTAIALLIVGSPCALIIATPTATLAGISRAAKMGLLFKGGQAVERLSRLGAVCLDKTGTLTVGRPRLRQVHAIGWSEGDELLSVAAALESGSTHPIATAVVDAAKQRGLRELQAVDIRDEAGKGLSGTVGGVTARLGTIEFCEPLVPVCLRNRARDVIAMVRDRGQLAVVVAWARAGEGHDAPDEVGEAAVLILSDVERPGARAMIDGLHALGVEPVRMLTGDNRVTAQQVADRLGIDLVNAELLPQDKVRLVEETRRLVRSQPRRGKRFGVGVVGDGVNDAPALAAADVSIAIGSIGSDAALESADIVLLGDDLRVIPWAVALARRTRAIITFNLFLALGIIVLMGIVVLVGSRTGWDVPMSVAVLTHEGGTLLVVLNSLRLLWTAPPATLEAAAAPEESPE